MLDVISDISAIFVISIGFAIVGMLAVRLYTVKQTRARYLVKTSLIILIVLYILFNLMFACSSVYTQQDITGKVINSTVSILLSSVYAIVLQKLLSDDDDDWFGDRRKKLKDWLKTRRRHRALKPVTSG